ncbi:MAG: hypothetical protein GF330_12800 [Candidatus Eisenbacteria bacterium]|nr:hypothetical protein [Candidatus Eisenbacteria bacterium]
MKTSPEERRITERMQPGVLSRDGFLGEDRRSLGEIIDADRSSVLTLGFDQATLAARLQEILEAAMEGMGAPVRVGLHLEAVYRESMGRIPCPFGDGARFPKGEVELTDTSCSETLRFTPLSVHMIAAHGFFQGRGSRYRISPHALARVLGPRG